MGERITCNDGVMDEGQESFVVRTSRASYVYQKAGCGFSSLVDRDGNDWIGYHPRGEHKGHYRGIPNMGNNAFGHPGYETGRTELVEASESVVTLRSTADDGKWDVEWNFFSTHASMTAHRIAAPVWLLYEGTPGGKFNPDMQFMYWSDGATFNCSERFRQSIPAPKWVAFCDPKTRRSLALAYDGPDTFIDTYWPMYKKGGMTVFGFGRSDQNGFEYYVENVPFRFSFALIESVVFQEIAAYVKAYLPVS
ncbi:MAG: hypothetical protein JXR25_09935 [Pontiellaceae bacterium]|nr:hypothetical protein [Pontiellaceae bacterium]MBN2785137.1 hypothetical protein [Pontiellaceae bacterium]